MSARTELLAQVSVRQVIAELTAGDGWLSMTEEGDVQGHASPEALLRWLRRRDAKRDGIAVTVLEWRGPEGFTPPAGKVVGERKLPKALRDSDDYHDNPEAATDLWNKGYRPMHAEDLKAGMTVAFRETDVFRFDCVGPVRFATVERVSKDQWGQVLVEHTGNPRGEATECDDWSEVWAKGEQA